MGKIEIQFLEEEITIFSKSGLPLNIWKGWFVKQGDHMADGLCYDEMLGLVASLTMPSVRPCLSWMETPETKLEKRKQLQ